MREIKFRAWDKKGKVGMVDNPRLEVVFEDKRYIIMQFIGLKDKNGKEIYEGDIIKSNEINFQIVWSQLNAEFYCLPRRLLDRKYSPHMSDIELYKVIGNIYENPELMENKGGK